jgi:hypothetical protein
MTGTVRTLTLTDKQKAVKDFQRIPGVGRQIAEDLWDLGYQAVIDLRGENPQAMYDALCVKMRMRVDRCMLYVFRCAVYFASHKEHDPELLKWWKWKDAPQSA